MAYKAILDTIAKLGREDGLTDEEISKEIGCSRATINRNRIRYNIPKADVRNRKDKGFVCLKCHKKVFIRRKEVLRLYCEKCEKLLLESPDTIAISKK